MVQGNGLTQTLVVIGQGYVGLPMALRAAEEGLSVTGLDTNPHIVKQLNSGSSHIDDVTDQELQAGLAVGYTASTDPACISDADVVVVCVPTPLGADGGPDLRPIEAAGRTIGQNIRPGTLCILESTTYPGTTEEIFAPLVCGTDLVPGEDTYIAFSPERIDPGNTTYRVKNTPKVVGGVTPACTRRAKAFYAQLIDTVVEAKGAKEAEMAKLLENTFRHVNIALVNEMVRFSNDLHIDLWDAIACAESKPFGFMAFRPGPGVGGHCIPVDPSYLSHRVKAELGYAFRMVELAEEINAAAPDYVASRLQSQLNEQGRAVNGSKVLIVGVTYKPNISDCRESPADPLAARLLSWGARLSYYDPYVPEWHPRGTSAVFSSESDVYQAAEDADVVALLQPHGAIDLERLARARTSILDTRAALPTISGVVRRL